MPEWSEFWWTSITGPRNLCDAVSRALHNKSSVCLVVPDDLPWRDEMRASIETGMHQMPDMESFYVEFIDVEDECSDIADIGRYLMERYALPEIAAGYRGREKLQKYILDKQVLDNRVLWIKGMNASQEKRWLQFCRDYVPVKDSDGRFVLEARWTDKENERRNLAVIRYGDTIKRYDLTLFNSIYLNREKGTYSAIWQQYAAVMCALLCNTDAETSQAFMDTCDFTAEEPIIGMRKIAADGAYLRRAESSNLHILSLVRKESISAIDAQIWKAQLQVLFPLLEIERVSFKESISAIDAQIWKAQLQVLFPLLEIERVSFIKRYRKQVQEALGEKYHDFRTGRSQYIYQFGETVSDPDNAELGTIYRMTKLRRDADAYQYLLYIPNEQSRSRIELLHDLRNSLAHGNTCAIDKVIEFINGHPFDWN